jgi:hypothetical protein
MAMSAAFAVVGVGEVAEDDSPGRQQVPDEWALPSDDSNENNSRFSPYLCALW